MDFSSPLMFINSNKFVAGIAMIIMNFGTRYIISDLSKMQDELLRSGLAKQIVLLCVFFIATRDVMISFMLTFAYQVLIAGFLNENKKYSIIKRMDVDPNNIFSQYNLFVNNIKTLK